MLDEYVFGIVSRICPEAPVPVLDIRSRQFAAGGAANVAVNIATLGASVQLIGVTGQDPAADNLRQILSEKNVTTTGLARDETRTTISKTRIVAGQQQICRIDHDVKTDLTGTLLDRLLTAIEPALNECTVVVLSDYAKGTLTDKFCETVIGLARANGNTIVVDPKSRDFQKYRGCGVITPNLAEASLAAQIPADSENAAHRAGEILMRQLPGASILITRGAEGMTLFEPGAPPVSVPTIARKVFDVVGAGDTAVAALAVALASGFSLRDAVTWANTAAGIVVEKPGTATVQLSELLAYEHPRELPISDQRLLQMS